MVALCEPLQRGSFEPRDSPSSLRFWFYPRNTHYMVMRVIQFAYMPIEGQTTCAITDFGKVELISLPGYLLCKELVQVLSC